MLLVIAAFKLSDVFCGSGKFSSSEGGIAVAAKFGATDLRWVLGTIYFLLVAAVPWQNERILQQTQRRLSKLQTRKTNNNCIGETMFCIYGSYTNGNLKAENFVTFSEKTCHNNSLQQKCIHTIYFYVLYTKPSVIQCASGLQFPGVSCAPCFAVTNLTLNQKTTKRGSSRKNVPTKK